MGNTIPTRATGGKNRRGRCLFAGILTALLIVALLIVYAHDSTLSKNLSFPEPVRSGYSVYVNVSSVRCSVAVRPYAGELLWFNVTEVLGWGATPIQPVVGESDNGSEILLNLHPTGGASPFAMEEVRINIYTPMVRAHSLNFSLDTCSLSVSGLNAGELSVFVVLGSVHINMTGTIPESVSVVTQTGNIFMGIPLGQGFTVNATTVNGEIHLNGATLSTLVHNAQSAYGNVSGGGPHVYIASIDGSITIQVY
ncbi:MAG: hypothetical protein QW429_05955 [Thermoprotei archaeon]